MNIALNLPKGMSQNLVMVCKYGRFSRFSIVCVIFTLKFRHVRFLHYICA